MSAEPRRSVHALTALIVKGDQAAFREFFDEYYPRLHRYLLVATRGNDAIAQDALQRAFLRVVRYLKPCRDPDQLWRWLTRVARTALIDEVRVLRRNGPGESVSLQYAAEIDAERLDDGSTELTATLDQCMGELAAVERNLLEAFYYHGMSQASIALKHGLTEKAVESRLARIRRHLRALILERLQHVQR